MKTETKDRGGQKFVCLRWQKMYSRCCSHIYARYLCNNQSHKACGHGSMSETVCLPLILPLFWRKIKHLEKKKAGNAHEGVVEEKGAFLS